MKRGKLTYAEAERLAMFLEIETLGLGKTFYTNGVYASRRREAAKLGYAASDFGAQDLEVELAELLAPYLEIVNGGYPVRARAA